MMIWDLKRLAVKSAAIIHTDVKIAFWTQQRLSRV